MGVATTLFLSVSSILDTQNKRTRTLSLKLDSLEIQHFVATILSHRDNCACQIGGRTIDLTATPPELTATDRLTEIRSGCDFTSPDNIIVKEPDPGPPIFDGMVKDMPGARVTDISLRNVLVDPDNSRLYHANIVIQYEDTIGRQSIRPSIVDFRFFKTPTDPTNPMNANVIGACFAPIKGSHECQAINDADTLAGCEGTIEVTGGATSFGHMSGHSELPASNPSSSGAGNIFVGSSAGVTNTTGESNTFIGSQSGQNNLTGSLNTFVGYKTGFSTVATERNVLIGSQAFENVTGMSNDNTTIGYQAGLNTTIV